MEDRSRTALALHGLVVIVAGLLAGFPYALAISGDLGGDVRAWRMAHLEGLLNGLLMLGVAGAGKLFAVSPREARLMTIGLLVAGYGNVVASVIAAASGVRGLSAAGPAANLLVFTLFMAAIVGVLVGLAVAIQGALRRNRAAGP